MGAASRYRTAEWGSPAGGVPAFFGKNGRRWTFPEVRSKPGATGTSASAPHVAAVAARIPDQRERYRGGRGRFMGAGIRPRMPPTDVKPGNIGGDIGPQRVDNANGFDFDTGFGFVDAQRALRATRGF